MTFNLKHAANAALAISLGLSLGACASSGGDGGNNFQLNSVHQPVVERSNFVLDLRAGSGGLDANEQTRLADWFETLDLGYGDRVSIDSGVNNPAVREDVAAIAGRHGILLSDGAPLTPGAVNGGNVRIVVTRSTASVPGCPDWGDSLGFQQGNHTSDGYGCAVNGNLAAMVADPEHLLEGASGTGETVVMTSNRAIDNYRNTAPTGGGEVTQVSTGGN